MGKVSYHFFTCLFNALLVYIILINFTGWSGAYIDIVGQNDGVNWSNSYFGFSSISRMLSEANVLFSNDNFKIPNFLMDVRNLLNTIAFSLPQLVSDFANQSADIITFLRVIIDLLFQPLVLVVRLFKVLSYLFYYVVTIIAIFMRAFGGAYNIPFDNITDYHPSSLVIPPTLASGFML